jgi:hypothetical protein
MRKVFATILFSLFVGVAMAMSASDNKGDKKDDGKDKDKDKGQKPILIVTWEFAWPPVFREVSELDSFEIGLVPPQEIQ